MYLSDVEESLPELVGCGVQASSTERDAANVRRDFRAAIRRASGLDPAEWTLRELRHSFVSLLSALLRQAV